MNTNEITSGSRVGFMSWLSEIGYMSLSVCLSCLAVREYIVLGRDDSAISRVARSSRALNVGTRSRD